jgi:hypothetical protein
MCSSVFLTASIDNIPQAGKLHRQVTCAFVSMLSDLHICSYHERDQERQDEFYNVQRVTNTALASAALNASICQYQPVQGASSTPESNSSVQELFLEATDYNKHLKDI